MANIMEQLNGERRVFSTMVLGQLAVHMPKKKKNEEELQSKLNTLNKSQIKMDPRSKCKNIVNF